MILFLEGSQNGTDAAKSVWPACTASHSPAPVRPCGRRRILCFAERSAGRYAPPGAVCAGHTGEYHGLPEGGPVHRSIRRRTAGGVLYPALLRPERTQLCGLSGGAPGGVGALGQCGQRSGPPGLAGQRSAAEAAGSGAASCPARHRGSRGHRQPGESIQPEQCPCLRFCHCRPP